MGDFPGAPEHLMATLGEATRWATEYAKAAAEVDWGTVRQAYLENERKRGESQP